PGPAHGGPGPVRQAQQARAAPDRAHVREPWAVISSARILWRGYKSPVSAVSMASDITAETAETASERFPSLGLIRLTRLTQQEGGGCAADLPPISIVRLRPPCRGDG